MNVRKKCVIISGIAAAIGGALGAVSGSNSWIVVAVVSIAFAVLAAWGLDGIIKGKE